VSQANFKTSANWTLKRENIEAYHPDALGLSLVDLSVLAT